MNPKKLNKKIKHDLDKYFEGISTKLSELNNVKIKHYIKSTLSITPERIDQGYNYTITVKKKGRILSKTLFEFWINYKYEDMGNIKNGKIMDFRSKTHKFLTTEIVKEINGYFN